MSTVTHANERLLANLGAEADKVTLQFFSLDPVSPLQVTLKRGDKVLYDGKVIPDPKNGNTVVAPIPADGSGDRVLAVVKDASGKELLHTEAALR